MRKTILKGACKTSRLADSQTRCQPEKGEGGGPKNTNQEQQKTEHPPTGGTIICSYKCVCTRCKKSEKEKGRAKPERERKTETENGNERGKILE